MVKGNIGILIQARMASKRLPGKSLLNLNDNIKVVDAVYIRCAQSMITDNIIFCISDDDQDNPLADYLDKKRYKFYRGNKTNLVDRFTKACETYNLDSFIRVTGDNPLVDPEIINYFSSFSKKFNFIDGYSLRKLPNGTIVSRLSYKLIKFLHENETDEYHLEHVVTSKLINDKLLPEIKKEWTNPLIRYCIDYPEDYDLLINLFKMDNILKLKTEELINYLIKRNPPNIIYARNGY